MVRVRAGARRDEVAGIVDGMVIVTVSAPAHGGRANRALCRLLAKHLGLAPSRLMIVRGQRSREKLVVGDARRLGLHRRVGGSPDSSPLRMRLAARSS
jgi:uncharacterized protein